MGAISKSIAQNPLLCAYSLSITLFLHEMVQTEAVSIHFGIIFGPIGVFWADFIRPIGDFGYLCHDTPNLHLT